jgi:hypothetical protein
MVGDGKECVILAFLLAEWNSGSVYQWTPHDGTVSLYHSVAPDKANDVVYDPTQGSEHAWLVNFTNEDAITGFVPGSGTGYDQKYVLPVAIPYPKQVVVYNGEILVAEHWNGIIYRYTTEGVEIGTVETGYTYNHGMAVANGDLYVTVYDSGSTTSSFLRYDAEFTVQETIPMPTGMVGTNPQMWDFAYAPGLDRFFGLAIDGNASSGDATTVITEFVMGGAVVNTHTIPFAADGIGLGIGPLLDIWADDFTTGVAATVEQCARWVAFRETPRDTVAVRMFGSEDPEGIICNDAVAAQQIADALSTGTSTLIPCDEHDWAICDRTSYIGFWIDPPALCSGANCPNPGYMIRPCITPNTYWGGVNTATCEGPDQRMSVKFYFSEDPP